MADLLISTHDGHRRFAARTGSQTRQRCPLVRTPLTPESYAINILIGKPVPRLRLISVVVRALADPSCIAHQC
jgi:hypothetical protein